MSVVTTRYQGDWMGETELLTELESPEEFSWPISKINVILISGKAGVGKTTLAMALKSHLRSKFPLVVKGSFADGVKSAARNCFYWNGVKDSKGRSLLQGIGNLGRKFKEDLWVVDLIEKIMSYSGHLPPDVLIVDDWRFPNESEYFIRYPDEFKLITVRIISPEREILKGTEEYFDESEVSLDNYPVDIVLLNPSSMLLGEFTHTGIEEITKFI